MKAKNIMTKEVITVKGDASIEEIAKTFVDNHISGVPVVDDDNKVIGIVTEGDLIHQKAVPRLPGILSIMGAFIYFQGRELYEEDFKKLSALNAFDIMTPNVITIPKHMKISEIASIIIDKKINRLPVVRNGKLIGIVSREDIVRSLLMDSQLDEEYEDEEEEDFDIMDTPLAKAEPIF
ncbi:MAG: CBS domain-containing protein [Bacillota bacterium]